MNNFFLVFTIVVLITVLSLLKTDNFVLAKNEWHCTLETFDGNCNRLERINATK